MVTAGEPGRLPGDTMGGYPVTIAVNIDGHCLITGPGRVEVQPALSGAEVALLTAVATGTVESLYKLSVELNMSYAHAWQTVKRLQRRGMIAVNKNGSANTLIISALVNPVGG